MKKKTVLLTLLLAIVMVLSACDGNIQTDDTATLVFVSLNDVHGYIEQTNGEEGLSNTAYAIDNLSAYSGNDKKMMGYNEDVVLFANGDMFQGTAISNMSHGRAVVEAMNKMGFVGMGIGNHEFDWGIEEITQYFDNDSSNGEANFPLVSSNIKVNSTNELLANESATDNVVSSLVVEKLGVKIGLISTIGPCQNDILHSRVEPYTFEDVVTAVKREALLLKANGAEVISVNIHYGNANGIDNYSANKQIAQMKGDDGEYLVDVIFNGHTHTSQSGTISRSNGTDVPVCQAGGYNEGYCYAKINYNKKTGETSIIECNSPRVSNVGKNCINEVETVIENYSANLLNNLPTLAMSSVDVYGKSFLYNYVGEIMVNAFGTDYALSNQGGIRSGGGIEKNKPITEANLYEVIPFDNEVYVLSIKGSTLYEIYSKDQQNNKYYFGRSKDAPNFSALKDSNKYFTLAIIDYVYTGEYFTGRYADYSSSISSSVATHLMLRDMLILDVKLHGDKGETWSPNNGALVTKQSY